MMASNNVENDVELAIKNAEETNQPSNPTDDQNEESADQKTTDNETDNIKKSEITAEEFTKNMNDYDRKSVQKAITKYIKNTNSDVYPAPFLGNLFPKQDDKINWHNKAVPPENPHLNFYSRVRRATIIILTPLIFIIVATVQEVQTTHIIGGCLLAMFTLYFLQVFFYIFLAKGDDGEHKLYRVYSTSDVPDEWTNLKTGYIQLLYRDESIQSISEISAINGGVTKTMLNTLGAYTWCAVLIHFVGQLYYVRDKFEWDPADICALIGTTGLLLISIFELDPFSKYMQTMHYVGAALGTCTITAYCLQQYTIGQKFWFAILIGVVAATFFILWMLVGIATDLKQIESKAQYDEIYAKKVKDANANNIDLKDIKINCWQPLVCGCLKDHNVNRFSQLNIVFEAIFLYLGAVSLCLFLIEYDRECGCYLGCGSGRNFDWSCFCPSDHPVVLPDGC